MTNNAGLEPALELLLRLTEEDQQKKTVNKIDDSDDDISDGDDANAQKADVAGSEAAATPLVAKSLKCEECGKLFKDNLEAEVHAVRTKHSNFSESAEEKPPLTDEEKQTQMQLVEQKLKQKRLEREQSERRDELERERNRIRSGKEMTEARKRLEQLEMQKIVEQRKREKAEEKQARDRVRAQIEADKAARRAKESGNSATVVTAAASTTLSAPSTSSNNIDSASSATKKEYTHTRLQIRLRNGSAITETFSVKEQLSAVRVFIQMKTDTAEPFALMTTFPRKVFTDEDFEKPIEAFQLVPSAVLFVTKPN